MQISQPRIIAMAVAVALSCPLGAQAAAVSVEQLEAQLQALQQQIQELKASQKDLSNQLEAQGKEAVVKGDIPASFRRAGEETSIHLYGFVELNAVHNFGGENNGDYASNAGGVALTGSAAAERKGSNYMHGRTSRFGIEAATPTSMGPLTIKVEGDFNNDRGGSNGGAVSSGAQYASNGYMFRLRHAYGQVGPWLVGQTWSTFMDLDSTPETVDFNGPVGNTMIRQPQVRYTYVTPNFGNYTLALENNSSQLNGGDGANISRVPDVIVRWDKAGDWGTLSFRAVSHDLSAKTNSLTASKRGYGVGLGNSYKITDADMLFSSVTYGDGIGRYFNSSDGPLLDSASGKIYTERQLGLVFGFQHKFSGTLRTNLVYGQQRLLNADYSGYANTSGQGTINRALQQAFVDTIWNPLPNVDLGAEFIWSHRETLDGQTGSEPRVNLSAKYNFGS
ncbi:DcaP family trimeric outer membrane transporter [Uliginosibacterium gangwonense]|uniref:DcaP family trimeric outer membrane transporter n=1 Tax=Uliginosibacterium gangwonense TaxID=392736 RepID=UPI00037CC493|nr:DcaP family trimeric outer membrane transporter [Uliginosibacterium gangwonense]